jgi:histidine triad (HIT) family protein
MKNCIFCKIIAEEIPSVKLYEDELVYAFMDIAPINYGHTLVIPKEHHTSVATIPENVAGRMFLVGSRLGVAMRRALDADGFNLHLSDGTVAGQVVMHAHLHIVPRWTDDSFHWNWRQLKYESEDVRNEMAEKLKKAFKLSSEGEEKE